jgi:Transcription initiation factor TFIID component TAF4 family
MEKMIIAAKHRTLVMHTSLLSRDKHLLFTANQSSPIDVHVMVKSDIKKTLSALEQDEIDEDKQMRLDRGEDISESVFGFDTAKKGGAINMSGAIGKKAKPVAMPEMMKSKLVNATALKAAGGVLKSWMLPKGSADVASVTGGDESKAKVLQGKKKADTSLDPYIIPMGLVRNTQVRLGRPMTQKESRRITLKDALHCLEGDTVLRKSSLLVKWYAKIK